MEAGVGVGVGLGAGPQLTGSQGAGGQLGWDFTGCLGDCLLPARKLRRGPAGSDAGKVAGEREIPRDVGLSRGVCGIWGVSGILKSKAGRLWAN